MPRADETLHHQGDIWIGRMSSLNLGLFLNPIRREDQFGETAREIVGIKVPRAGRGWIFVLDAGHGDDDHRWREYSRDELGRLLGDQVCETQLFEWPRTECAPSRIGCDGPSLEFFKSKKYPKSPCRTL